MNTFLSSPFHMRSDAPWIPLDELLAQWAMFGKEATTAEQLEATSHAFTALASERKALQAYTSSTQAHHHMHRTWCMYWDDLVREKAPILTHLQQAADQWYEAASLLITFAGEVAQFQDEQQPEEWTMPTFIGLALEQRLRVWTIAQHLLLEQVTGYWQAKGVTPSTTIGGDADQQREERRG